MGFLCMNGDVYLDMVTHSSFLPRGSIYTTIMGLSLKNHNGDGLLGPNSIMVVYMDPLGYKLIKIWGSSSRI